MAFTVAHGELDGYPIANYGAKDFVGVRRVWVDWDERNQFLDELLTPANWQWPYRDISAYVESFRELGHGKQGHVTGDTTLARYVHAHYEIVYRSMALINGTELLSERVQHGMTGEYIDTSNMKWESDGTAIASSVALLSQYPYVRYIRTLHHQPGIRQDALDLLGTCNINAYASYSAGLQFPVETLRFVGVSGEHKVLTTGKVLWTVPYVFEARAVSWNKHWRAQTSQWDYITNSAGVRQNQYTPAEYGKQFG